MDLLAGITEKKIKKLGEEKVKKIIKEKDFTPIHTMIANELVLTDDMMSNLKIDLKRANISVDSKIQLQKQKKLNPSCSLLVKSYSFNKLHEFDQ